jgi:hypothetical protein
MRLSVELQLPRSVKISGFPTVVVFLRLALSVSVLERCVGIASTITLLLESFDDTSPICGRFLEERAIRHGAGLRSYGFIAKKPEHPPFACLF